MQQLHNEISPRPDEVGIYGHRSCGMRFPRDGTLLTQIEHPLRYTEAGGLQFSRSLHNEKQGFWWHKDVDLRLVVGVVLQICRPIHEVLRLRVYGFIYCGLWGAGFRICVATEMCVLRVKLLFWCLGRQGAF